MKILDATCSIKSMWYQKSHPFVTFMDIRNGKYIYQDKKKKHKPKVYTIKPDVTSDFRDTPFDDNYFDMIVFDPPHIIQNANSGDMIVRYGKFNIDDNWKQILSDGIMELFRVLKPNSVFILKWSKTKRFGHSIPLKEILDLFPYQPMFGTRTGNSDNNHWVVFIKYDVNQKLIEG